MSTAVTLRSLARSGAKKAPLPEWIAPELATLAEAPPAGDDWIHENKFDGYRLVVKITDGSVRIFTRNRNDWTADLPLLAKKLEALPLRDAYLDGELTVLEEDGRPNFQRLQNMIKSGDQRDFVLYLFDLMYWDGYDLRGVPLILRKQALKSVLAKVRGSSIRFSDFVTGHGARLFSEACRERSEGIISKSARSLYQSRRTLEWIKCKCVGEEEFVIVGFTPHSKDRRSIGSLLLATREPRGRRLKYSGKVGTGFSDKDRRTLFGELSRLSTAATPVEPGAPLPRGPITWVVPKRVAQIRFTERTDQGLLRHPSYLGLRLDKPAAEVIEERAIPRSQSRRLA